MASASATDSCDHYDVFLSFRGGDTRHNFISHLHEDLRSKMINVFVDENITRGNEITQAIERVIEGAKISIIVFSPDYASSTFCLDELVKIMQCQESKQQIVLPVFYKVEPSRETYKEAFRRHMPEFRKKKRPRKETNEKDRVREWKSAFHKAIKLAGWPIDHKCNEAEKIKKITSDVLAKLKKLNSSQSKGEEVMSTSMVGQTAEDNFKRIWECLMNDDTTRVGIHGMGGVGKTTIATRINNQLLEVANPFTHIYWVTVSKDSSIYKLQSGIARKMKMDLSEEDDEKRRAALLRKELENKKFLLILDDVWEAYELTKDVGIPFDVGGGKLLLTTRDLRVCKRMQCQSFLLEPLSRCEAWDLFVEESQCKVDGSLEWGNIAESIVKQCAGLPLAIVVVARRMRGIEEISEWRYALRELERPCEGENHEMEEMVFKPLKFSYDHLPNDKYRQCFLYCSLFPEDYEIKSNDLIEYWIGEGLINELDSKHFEIDEGNHIIDKLVCASLLEYGRKICDVQHIKMHDVIRDMARIHLKVGLQFRPPSKEIERSFNFGHVEVLTDKDLRSHSHSAPNCSKLGTLVLKSKGTELPGCFFTNMQRLTILEMDGVNFSPDCITHLENLRMLSLVRCKSLNYIPSSAKLENLRYLKIVWTRFREIPEGLERLASLRVLKLSRNSFLCGSFPSVVLEKLSNLQSLLLDGTKLEVELDALNALKKLEMLRLSFHDLRKLNCYLKSGHWRRLVEYHIYYVVEGTGNLLKSYKKKAISLEAIWNPGTGTRETDIFFPEDVQFLQLIDWESPMLDVLRHRTFVDLQKIEFKRYKGSYLFTSAVAQQLLHNTEELEFKCCYRLEEIIATKEEYVYQSIYPFVVLPKLKRLTIYRVYELRSIYRGSMVCRKLERIRADGCKKLERLPFCMEEEGNKQNPTIKIASYNLDYEWLDLLRWDNSNAKSMYQIQRLTIYLQ